MMDELIVLVLLCGLMRSGSRISRVFLRFSVEILMYIMMQNPPFGYPFPQVSNVLLQPSIQHFNSFNISSHQASFFVSFFSELDHKFTFCLSSSSLLLLDLIEFEDYKESNRSGRTLISISRLFVWNLQANMIKKTGTTVVGTNKKKIFKEIEVKYQLQHAQLLD